MRILFLTKSLPFPLDQGANIRSYFLLKHLSQFHDVYLLSIVRSERERAYCDELRGFCRDVRCVRFPRSWSRKLWDFSTSVVSGLPYTVVANTDRALRVVLEDMVARHSIDLIQSEELYVAANIPFHSSPPVILDAHNREPSILERMAAIEKNIVRKCFYRMQGQRMARFEAQMTQEVRGVFAVSKLEADYFRGLGVKTWLVPNGVEQTAPRALPHTSGILFTGLLSYPPNRESLQYFFSEVWRQIRMANEKASVTVVGRNPPRCLLRYGRDPRVCFLTSEEDIAPHLLDAKVMVVPLRAGGGTRFKILQAFSTGLPVVSTTVGAEGIDVTDGIHLLIRDDALGFAAAVLALLEDEEQASLISKNALKLVNDHYLWDGIVRTCLSAYEEVMRCAS